MIKSFIILVSLLIVSIYSKACEGCISVSNGLNNDVNFDKSSHFIRIDYSLFDYNLLSEYDFEVSDRFQSFTLSARYSINDRFRLLLSVPYGFNTRNEEGKNSTIKGVGDPRIELNWIVFKKEYDEGRKIHLDLGYGLNLPIGSFDPDIHDLNLPENFNIGRASFGNNFSMNSRFSFEQLSFIYRSKVILYTKTKDDYKFGNQFFHQVLILKQFELKEFSIIPSLGFSLEQSGRDRFANGNSNKDSGGTNIAANSSLIFLLNKLQFGLGFNKSIYNKFAETNLGSAFQINSNITFIF